LKPEFLQDIGMDFSNFGMDTVTLGGTLEEKIRAISDAGFSKIMLWAKDLIGHPEGVEAAVRKVHESGLRANGFQLLKDFEGLSGDMLEYKLDIAKSMMKMMQALGSNLLLVCSSMSPHATGDMQKIARDLAMLATLATPLGIRIGYEALAWGRWVNEYPAAWEAIKQADRENVGLVVDSFHVFARGTSLQYLDEIPAEKIFLVQLSDSIWGYTLDVEDLIESARHHRVFPGEGVHSVSVADLVRRVDKTGYLGDYNFEVFNDDYRQCPLPTIAARARKSAEWLSEQVSNDRSPS
jgi:2-keto-myo-inositol isomerase